MPAYLLRTGTLSLAAKAELARRVKEGEQRELVEAELLLREEKAVADWTDRPETVVRDRR
jgi:hypothetical protein